MNNFIKCGKIASLLLLTLLGMIAGSCSKNKCHATNCANGGTCSNGKCTCAAGYDGNNCEIDVRKDFNGIWNVHEHGSTTGSSLYTVSISSVSTANEVKITNYFNYFAFVTASVFKGDTIKLNNQQENAKIISGQGYYLKTASGTPMIILNSTITDSATGVTDHLTDTLN